MKRLIQNNFLYYFKNKTKLLISLGFIVSFIAVLFVYDNLELSKISQDANKYRADAYQYMGIGYMYPEYNKDYLDEIDFWNVAFENYAPSYDDEEINGAYSDYDGSDERVIEQIAIMSRLDSLSYEMYELLSSYASLHSGGRMNVELTPYRLEINTLKLELYDLVGEEMALKLIAFENPQSYDYVVAEQERLTTLMSSETPDDFNEYTISISNYPSKALEGISLFVIFVFILMLFYDLFSKDFDAQTYRSIYTEPYPRKTMVKSKVYFAMIYTTLLILLGMLTVVLYLLLSRRTGYNVLSTRFGYMMHPVIMNTGILSIFGQGATYTVVPMVLKNLLFIGTASLIIQIWLLFILTLSFKLKSSASTLTIGVFVLLAVFFVNFTPLNDLFSAICPLFGFSFERFFNGSSRIHMGYIILVSGIFMEVVRHIFYKNIGEGDLLGGDSHD